MKLNYKELGSGQPMIILHGLLGSLDNWQSLAKRFAENYHVFTVDQRNHGQSPHRDQIDYNLLSEDLNELIEERQLENVILIGHSMGGKTVMKFALDHPDKISDLIVVDISPREYPVHHEHIIESLRQVDFSVQKSRKQVEDFLMERLKDRGVVLFLTKNVYWKNKEELAFRFNLDALYDNLDIISSWPSEYTTFEGRTLFIRGSKANYITIEDEAIIGAYFPDLEMVSLESGHWVHAEKPDEFYDSVMRFLSA